MDFQFRRGNSQPVPRIFLFENIGENQVEALNA